MEVICVSSKKEYEDAIARVKNSPSTASKEDWEKVNKASNQMGELGNKAREAKGEKPKGFWG